jgi:hypothetical protein
MLASAGLGILITTWHHMVTPGDRLVSSDILSGLVAGRRERSGEVLGGRCHGRQDIAAGGGSFRDGQRIQESRRRSLMAPLPESAIWT